GARRRDELRAEETATAPRIDRGREARADAGRSRASLVVAPLFLSDVERGLRPTSVDVPAARAQPARAAAAGARLLQEGGGPGGGLQLRRSDAPQYAPP